MYINNFFFFLNLQALDFADNTSVSPALADNFILPDLVKFSAVCK